MDENEAKGARIRGTAALLAVPLAIALTLLAVVLSFWRVLAVREDEALRNKIQDECDFLASHIAADLRNRISTLERMARSWEWHGDSPEERAEFQEEARFYVADTPGFQAIERVGPDFAVQWAVPPTGNEKTIGPDLPLDESRHSSMARARDSRETVMSAPLELARGGKGFLVFFPLERDGRRSGYLLATLRARDWLEYAFKAHGRKDFGENFTVSVSLDDTLLLDRLGSATSRKAREATSSATMLERRLVVHTRATEKFIRANRSFMPEATAIFGALLSALTAAAVGLFAQSRSAAARANAANRMLTEEVAGRKKVEEDLRVITTRVDWALKASGIGYFNLDLEDGSNSWNDGMYDLYGIDRECAPSFTTWVDAIHPDDRDRTLARYRQAVERGARFEAEFRIVLPDGEIRHLRSAARVERDAEGKPRFMTGLNWDLSEERRARAALANSEEQVRLILNSTGEAIYGIDLAGLCTFANPACVRMLGYADATELLGRNMHWLIHHSREDGSPLVMEECKIYRAFREGKPEHVDDEVLWRCDGSSFPAEYWSYPQISNGVVRGAVVAFIDITERKRSEATIRHMATHDGLTDLPTMTLLRDRLTVAIASARRDRSMVAVMFVDLDGFKAVNDTWGHDAGDDLLREVARRLKSVVRDTDTVARIGGDEFVVVMAVHAPADVSGIATALIADVSRPHDFREARFAVGASVGVAFYPGDAETVDALIKRADEAMYAVKKEGKNGWRFASGPNGGNPAFPPP